MPNISRRVAPAKRPRDRLMHERCVDQFSFPRDYKRTLFPMQTTIDEYAAAEPRTP